MGKSSSLKALQACIFALLLFVIYTSTAGAVKTPVCTAGSVNSSGKVCRPNAQGILAWQSKYRVVDYGDSLGAEAYRYVNTSLTANGRAKVTNRTYPGSSPCDWNSAAKLDTAAGQPDAVIIETFGNNISNCQLDSAGNRPTNGSQAYWAAYYDDLVNLIGKFGTKVPIWLTAAPAARNDTTGGVSHKARMLQLMQQVADSRPNTFVVDAGASVENPGGTYAPYLPCLPNEECANFMGHAWNDMHSEDGLHFCPRIKRATIALLRNCPVYASGAWRFGNAQADGVKTLLGL